jgi:hypothetical protein
VISAHCRWCQPGDVEPTHGLCRLNRTVRFGKNPNQGRPIGFLIAWLRRARVHEDRASHFEDRIGNGIIRIADRLTARAWAVNQPDLAFFLSLERGLRPGEGDEPDRNP